MLTFGPRAARAAHNKEYEIARRPQTRMVMPYGITPSFTITQWLLPMEATAGRPPPWPIEGVGRLLNEMTLRLPTNRKEHPEFGGIKFLL
jgi:hypothetical protein